MKSRKIIKSENGGNPTWTPEQWLGEIQGTHLLHIFVFQDQEKNFRKWGWNEIWSLAETGNSESLAIQINIGEENEIFNISSDDVTT